MILYSTCHWKGRAEEAEEEDYDAEEGVVSKCACSSRCQRRYPRLFTQLFWLYVIVEMLCFATDIAFLGTTVLAARSNHKAALRGMKDSRISSTSAENTTLNNQEDDDWVPVQTQQVETETETEEETLDWNSFQKLLLDQWKLQWEQQQAFVRTLMGVKLTYNVTYAQETKGG